MNRVTSNPTDNFCNLFYHTYWMMCCLEVLCVCKTPSSSTTRYWFDRICESDFAQLNDDEFLYPVNRFTSCSENWTWNFLAHSWANKSNQRVHRVVRFHVPGPRNHNLFPENLFARNSELVSACSAVSVHFLFEFCYQPTRISWLNDRLTFVSTRKT